MKRSTRLIHWLRFLNRSTLESKCRYEDDSTYKNVNLWHDPQDNIHVVSFNMSIARRRRCVMPKECNNCQNRFMCLAAEYDLGVGERFEVSHPSVPTREIEDPSRANTIQKDIQRVLRILKSTSRCRPF